jgi:hypothetical protein
LFYGFWNISTALSPPKANEFDSAFAASTIATYFLK